MSINIEKIRENFKDPYHLINTSDGKKLFLRIWNPKIQNQVAILIFHGITAYSGPYEMIGKFLSNIGFSVFGLDLRGHGLLDDRRGDYPSRERLIKDLCETIDFLKNKYQTLIILGHSLGVFSAILATNHCLSNINGLILISAGKNIRPGVYPKRTLFEKMKILFSSLLFKNKPIIKY